MLVEMKQNQQFFGMDQQTTKALNPLRRKQNLGMLLSTSVLGNQVCQVRPATYVFDKTDSRVLRDVIPGIKTALSTAVFMKKAAA
jgi:hypothetical protein